MQIVAIRWETGSSSKWLLRDEHAIQLNVANKDHGEVAERVSVLQGEKEVWH